MSLSSDPRRGASTPDVDSPHSPQSPPGPDDKLWEGYLDVASEADASMIKDWTTIIDVVLIYVNVFIAVLAPSITQIPKQFQRDPMDVSNDLLVALYNRAADPSSPIIDPDDLFELDPANQQWALIQGVLLCLSFGISLIISALASGCKLWIVHYGRSVKAAGSPFERAMVRQRAFSGAKAWKLGPVIEALPLISWLGVCSFGFLNYLIVNDASPVLGILLGATNFVALTVLVVPSICGAFVPAAPFQSIFSNAIKAIFSIVPTSSVVFRLGVRSWSVRVRALVNIVISVTWFTVLSLFGTGAVASIPPAQVGYHIPLACVLALMPIWEEDSEDNRAPRMFGLPAITLIGMVSALAVYITQNIVTPMVPIAVYLVFPSLMAAIGCLQAYFVPKMLQTPPNTTEAEAVVWMITSSAIRDARWSQKAVDLTTKYPNLHHFLFQQLFPAFRSLINTSKRAGRDETAASVEADQDVHIKHLARLADFEDAQGSILRNVAPRRHGRLGPEDPLRDKLKMVVQQTECLSSQ